jgi:hypothetical protein
MNLEQKPKRINTDTENLEILLCVCNIYYSVCYIKKEEKRNKKPSNYTQHTTTIPAVSNSVFSVFSLYSSNKIVDIIIIIY